MRRLTISGHACTETLAVLIAVAWADGRLDESEREGVRGAAQILNLTRELRQRLEALLQQPIDVDQLLFDTLSARERDFAFVAAAWMAHVDRNLDEREAALLERIGDALKLSPARRRELVALVHDLPAGGAAAHGWSEQIAGLFRAIPRTLEPQGEDVEFAVE